MPRYDFECEMCHQIFELTLTMKEREKDSSKKQCPACSSQKVKPLISGVGILRGGQSKSLDSPPCGSVSCGCPDAGACKTGCDWG